MFVLNDNKTKITTKLADSFGNSMVHKKILFSCNISFDPLLTRPSSAMQWGKLADVQPS